MVIDDWVKKEVTAEQLQEPYKTIAEEIGIENTVKLAGMYQGTPVYFPKFDNVISDIRNKKIRTEYNNGATYKELALKYGITERWVYEIVGNKIDENQMSFFR